MEGHHTLKKASLAGVLLSLGIVFGDIGTSPLYVLKAICGEREVTEKLVLGGLSCIFWTLTFQTTLKYVLITLRADNKGEGGIFSLYTLVRRRAKWLFIPVMIGGATLLADGIITPSISVTSAVEGLERDEVGIDSSYIIPIVTVILVVLFLFQRMGTRVVGSAFGFVMLVWFGMLATLGLSQILPGNFFVFKALNPVYAWDLLSSSDTSGHGFWILGAVFLCTTGAEALYSDLGHCGRANIRVSWIFVKVCLLINYFGQGAWLLNTYSHKTIGGDNPFYGTMPEWFLIPGIIIATMATIIASQALISGSYTLVNEAMRLNFWPKAKIVYPTVLKEQPYIPGVNWMLLAGCLMIVFWFQESSKMEAAYGLAITITMLMTTLLLLFYLTSKPAMRIAGYFLIGIFVLIESAFLIANLEKFPHGGWVTLLIGMLILLVMWSTSLARNIKNRFTPFVKMKSHVLPRLRQLSSDESVPKFSTHLVYLTNSDSADHIEAKIEYSIFNKRPKRADVYWFIHVDVVDEPSTREYSVEILDPGHVVWVKFRLGFRIEPRINLYLRKVIKEMVAKGEIDILSRYTSLRENAIPGDFRFVVIERILNYDYDLTLLEELGMDLYSLINRLSLSDERAFGLDTSLVEIEKVPLIVSKKGDDPPILRISE